jgi:hypothetical protein
MTDGLLVTMHLLSALMAVASALGRQARFNPGAGHIRNGAAQAARKEARGYDESSPTDGGRGRSSVGLAVGLRCVRTREPGRINHD